MEHDFIIITDENVTGQEEKVSLGPIAKFVLSAAGRQQLAASMIAPIRTRLDYQGIARKLFLVEQLPDALPSYDKDAE